MRIGHFAAFTDFASGPAAREQLEFLAQIGVQDVVLHSAPIERCEPLTLVEIRETLASFDLRLISVENLEPQSRVLQPIILGLPERDEAIAAVQRAIVAMGQAQIPFYGLHWHLPINAARGGNGVVRTSFATRGRGDSLVTSFDASALPIAPTLAFGRPDVDELWANYEHFLRAVLPVAEQAGVVLGLHPHDPPLPEWDPYRIFARPEDFGRAQELAGSSSWGLTFCLGNWQLMGDGAIDAGIRRFGPAGAINYVHVQSLRGTADRFAECFLEEGDCDLGAVVTALREVRYDGALVPAHSPHLAGAAGDPHHERTTAYAVGYVRALLKTLG